ncbi:guanine nucleotide-binding protein G(o) subunit alpha [Salpingoeca rosetta]|uniref:Guanine nucleotide-binding protein G(O) subunit alpha n=1 Tax=Salpingoeca rosetta (strain ATCC 50818 / BSB-021) TaxID=946362 RepID=F2UH11_SALR5|nr:guanine nucleotide-binding protein G(o) subunit alpha [Salpingoeca rosetta]EGD76410.1 guanine nucleotide-binding protein G(o) subunit alpha [Salpingoeca rosetta]|eukprot:XP_004991325.1 guanine nucleotide-binding protein G(o) subunit alpha [Salpingoeca rosetta]
MGICMSAEQKAAAARSAALDRQLDQDRAAASKTIKLLLLGAGESGKSTLVKQMKIIHGDGFTQEELRSYRPTIADNLVHSMRAVLEAMGALFIDLGDQANRVHAKAVLTYVESGSQGQLTPELTAALKSLWADSGVQECFRRSNEYQLNDSAEYFFNSIDRISSPSYMPTEQDVLRARVRTTGIIETKFTHRDLTYRMFDVGGQRSERRKWIQCFDDVTAVIFVAALSGYDMKLYEDQETNRIHESLTLFDAICNNKFFLNTAMILFLNKTDLFSQKIARTPLSQYFPEYDGPPNDAAAARKFILSKFLALNRNPKKTIYEHFTCATDTSNIRHVFDSVSDIIIERNLNQAGLGSMPVM